MSTQYLFQPFVWAHWPWDEVLAGWVEVVRDRAVVAVAIALAIVGASASPARSSRSRALTLGVAILLGALAGELILLALGFPGEWVDARSIVGRIAHWSFLGASVAAMAFLWLRITEVHTRAQAEELRRVVIERQLVQVRLQTLRNQIEPHFLFNTLATVRRLQRSETEQGAQLLRHFLDYLRLSVTGIEASLTTLGEEIALVKAYLGVVDVRMSGRLQTRFEVPESLLGCRLPPLMLATLVENAVKHGIGPKPEGGLIEVSATRTGDMLVVVVSDAGVGFGFGATHGSGIGLSNIRSRLKTMYGADGRLALEQGAQGGVRATLSVPCEGMTGAA